MLNLTPIKKSLPQSTKIVQILRICNEPQEVPVSEFVPF